MISKILLFLSNTLKFNNKYSDVERTISLDKFSAIIYDDTSLWLSKRSRFSLTTGRIIIVMSKKVDIINAAMEVLANQGYYDATISDIAEKAGVADATIYEHFKNKEDLLFSIPEEKMKEVLSLADLHLQGIKGAVNKIRKFVWFYLWIFESNINWASVVLLNLKTNRKFVSTPGYKMFQDLVRTLIDIVEEGKSEGSIRKEIDPFVFRSVLLGAIEHITIRWLILNKPEKLVSYADDITELLIQAVKV
jgi:TetR/AcrR family fatty acid metabolism transcriptional regulator